MVSSNKGRYKRRRRVLILCVVIPIVLYAGFVFARNMKTFNALKAELIEVNEELAEVQQENEQLQQEVEYTKTDAFIVQKARELLGYVTPGEIKYVSDN